MRVGVVLGDDQGLASDVCLHFGQCTHFLLAEINEKEKKIAGTKVVVNTIPHGGGGCVTVDEILKYSITHIIAGGMGGGAQQKLAAAGVKIYGAQGNVEKAINALLENSLGGLGACQGHGEDGHCH